MVDIPAGTTETLPVLVRQDDPILGEVDLSGYSVEVALPVDGVAPSSWTTTTWKTGTSVQGGDRYYVANLAVGTGGFALTGGTTYRAWVRVGGTVLIKADAVKAIST